MKRKNINKRFYKTAAALAMTLAIGIYFVATNIRAYAGNIIITGDAAGSFSITSEDTMLFDLTGLYPGDISSSSVTINNTDMINDGFEVFMYAKNTSEAEYDLGQVTRLTVTDGDITIYDDMLIDFDEKINSITPISLGRLAQGTSKNLDFTIEIDGEKANNNYKEQPTHFVITFIANSYGAPTVIPGPGGGGGGGGTPVTVLATTPTPPETPEPTQDEIINIADEDVPLGNIETEDTDESDDPQDDVEIEDEDVPLGVIKEMPKTGEGSLVLYIISSVLIICCGVFIIFGNGKNKKTLLRRKEDEK